MTRPIRLPRDPRRILIIKPSAIGDVVHGLPVLALLRRRWPGAHVAWVVTPGCSGILEGHPLLNELIPFERKRYGQGWRDPRAAAGLHSFLRRLRRGNYDLVIDLQGLFRSAWMAFRTGAPARVGFANAREFGWAFYNHRVKVPTPDMHAVDRYLLVTEALGCGRAPVEFPFATTDATREEVARLLPVEPFAAIFPGTNWETKRWPVARFNEAARALRDRHGLKIVAMGAPDEADLAARLDADVHLAGRTSLKQLPAILERAALVVTNDSGPMHIAAALNRPLVALFGPTNPTRTGPYAHGGSVVRSGIECSPCYRRTCWHQSCLQKLEIDPVLETAERQLAGRVALPILNGPD